MKRLLARRHATREGYLTQASRLAWIKINGVEYNFVDKIMFSSGLGCPNYSRSLSALIAHRHMNRGLMHDI